MLCMVGVVCILSFTLGKRKGGNRQEVKITKWETTSRQESPRITTNTWNAIKFLKGHSRFTQSRSTWLVATLWSGSENNSRVVGGWPTWQFPYTMQYTTVIYSACPVGGVSRPWPGALQTSLFSLFACLDLQDNGVSRFHALDMCCQHTVNDVYEILDDPGMYYWFDPLAKSVPDRNSGIIFAKDCVQSSPFVLYLSHCRHC